MNGGGRETLEGVEEIGIHGKDTGTGWRQTTGLGDVFQGGGAGGTLIWFMDVGDDPLHLQGPGEFSAKSFQADYGETAEVTGG